VPVECYIQAFSDQNTLNVNDCTHSREHLISCNVCNILSNDHVNKYQWLHGVEDSYFCVLVHL
jgi:hypothetical protein